MIDTLVAPMPIEDGVVAVNEATQLFTAESSTSLLDSISPSKFPLYFN